MKLCDLLRLAFLQPALTRIQFDNLTLVASALILGSGFNLTLISYMWLKAKQHHTNLCKCIHGVCVMFDHALKTNLKAVYIVVLYYSDGNLIKFPHLL